MLKLLDRLHGVIAFGAGRCRPGYTAKWLMKSGRGGWFRSENRQTGGNPFGVSLYNTYSPLPLNPVTNKPRIKYTSAPFPAVPDALSAAHFL
jgi:hypothetical protein